MVGEPLYQRVKRELVAAIESGEYPPDVPFVTQRKICERFGVSHATAVRALNDLVTEGYVIRRRGQGTFVAPRTAVGRRRLRRLRAAVPRPARVGPARRDRVGLRRTRLPALPQALRRRPGARRAGAARRARPRRERHHRLSRAEVPPQAAATRRRCGAASRWCSSTATGPTSPPTRCWRTTSPPGRDLTEELIACGHQRHRDAVGRDRRDERARPARRARRGAAPPRPRRFAPI